MLQASHSGPVRCGVCLLCEADVGFAWEQHAEGHRPKPCPAATVSRVTVGPRQDPCVGECAAHPTRSLRAAGAHGSDPLQTVFLCRVRGCQSWPRCPPGRSSVGSWGNLAFALTPTSEPWHPWSSLCLVPLPVPGDPGFPGSVYATARPGAILGRGR